MSEPVGTPPHSAFLRLQDLSLAYGSQPAVPQLNLNLAEGELLALLGPSGCGKTTTMRAIAGLLAPRAGRIHLAGRDITGVPAHRRDVGLVFQSYALFPHLSVAENLAFGLRLRGISNAERERRVAQGIALVGLQGLERRLPRELSGGQQQRVALARAVVVRPRLLLLDEPLSNLDASLRLEMRSELRRLQRDLGLSMVYVTHDQAEALALADRVVVMRAGRIAQQGTPQDIYQRPASSFVARFVGFENIFCVSQGHLRAVQAGDATALAWRARQVRLGQGPWRARVRGVSYLGEALEVLLHSDAGPLKAQLPADAPRPQLDAELAFDLPLAAAVSVSVDDATAAHVNAAAATSGAGHA